MAGAGLDWARGLGRSLVGGGGAGPTVAAGRPTRVPSARTERHQEPTTQGPPRHRRTCRSAASALPGSGPGPHLGGHLLPARLWQRPAHPCDQDAADRTGKVMTGVGKLLSLPPQDSYGLAIEVPVFYSLKWCCLLTRSLASVPSVSRTRRWAP